MSRWRSSSDRIRSSKMRIGQTDRRDRRRSSRYLCAADSLVAQFIDVSQANAGEFAGRR